MSTTMNSTVNHDKQLLEEVEKLREARRQLREEVAKVIVGQQDVVDLLLLALLCRGHVLLHGVPGLGKTLMARTLSQTLDLKFKRVQFTPDLMPSDITGTDVMEELESGGYRLKFVPGPIFTNFLLADEINRTPPKTQAALLQAMQEREVSIGNTTYSLDPPFFVVATQNPIEMEGTYPLPEAQVDRFMFNIRVGYPTVQEEAEIIRGTTGTDISSPAAVLESADLLKLQGIVRSVPVADDVVMYAARLVNASRPVKNSGDSQSRVDMVSKYVTYGASPRAGQSLILAGKARAVLEGRYHVDFEDVRALAHPVLRHRLVLNFHGRADNVDSDDVVDALLENVKDEVAGR
ncbi:AAA family ATPase [Allorhodopirellula heiligendammensis]|uniref:Holliday junction DNA helicase RuvB n=1 Tax=Allorhodopirellula heiligendammensis TaxID=2714739 RepID=A0A5C6BIB4_9BACT|nr:MoxR family ATPase [Allorhodopirellula heiligendammensis]TWU11056.1 Holliday junction DNA helicase RuvB [Allorhodopirellula heiligendammensis]